MNLNNHSSRRTGYDYNKSTYPFKLGPDHGDFGGDGRVVEREAVGGGAGQGAERGVAKSNLGQGPSSSLAEASSSAEYAE